MSVCAFSVGRDADVAAARGVGLVALVGEPARAVRHPACCRAAATRASCPRGRPGESIPSRDDERRAAGGGAGDDARRLAAGLDERVDRRVRADVGGVDRAGRERLDRGGTGVEDLRRHVDVAEGVLEEPLFEPDERGRVGDVGEVAQAQLAHGRAVVAARRDGVLPAAEAQPAIMTATSPRVVIVVAVRIVFTVRLLQVGHCSVGVVCATGSVAHDAGGERGAVGRMDDEERAPVAARAVRLERQVGRERAGARGRCRWSRASRPARG